MAPCHPKNAELSKTLQVYKGRIVFRGDNVKDETGHYAVFTDQGTSASYIAGTKMIDIVARSPGCVGQDADARSAFTQITIAEATGLLGLDFPDTWIKLPKERWPDHWRSFPLDYDPIVPLEGNLYGHPLAGLLWDKCSQEKIIACGFEKVRGWESL